MPRRELEKEFSRQLGESRFSFIPRGVHNLTEIYEMTKSQFQDLCDDEFKCFDSCNSGANSPEWKHILRGRLSGGTGGVRKAAGRGNWEFV
ncbi:hypothetical protein [Fontibacter flavus]|uniref:Uncharacterized protein n=1 Tax=Fontibacter flavus TaxID=654838 RepID=A0ABV6FVA5_9BACT